MDNKRMIVGILLIMALAVGYQYFLAYEYKAHPEWRREGDTRPSVSLSPDATTEKVAQGSQFPTTSASTQPAAWQVISADTTRPAVVGAPVRDDAHYHMALILNPAGAAIDEVALNEYQREVNDPALFTFQTPYESDSGNLHALATTAVILDGVRIDLQGKNFALLKESDHSAEFAIDLNANGGPAVRVVKEYILDAAQSDPGTSQGYEVQVNYFVQNLSDKPHTAAIEFSGPTEPKAETARQETEIAAGYDNDGLVKVEHQGLSVFKADPKDYVVNDDKLPLLWVGASSNYFNAIVRPADPKQIASVTAWSLNPTAPSDQRVVAIHFASATLQVPAGGAASLPMRVFFGPKKRELLTSKYYSSFPLAYDDTLILISSGICAFCTFPWLISFLVVVLAGLHVILRDWGLAIIALVIGVRLLLHPITKRSQVSMLKMQKLAPEMERLKKKFGDDKDGFTKAQMELYKSVGFTPVLGCLPMFLQMPIFIALWRALQTTFELRQAPFLYFFHTHFTWIRDLSQPDFLVKFDSPIPLFFGWHLAGINVLPLAMAVVTFVNQKYFTPKPAAMSAEQEQQQKMMTWMTLIFPFMFYTFPSGLNLYYLTSTTLGILESKRIRDHIKRAELLEATTGPVIVDAGKLARSARRRPEPTAAPAKKKGWLAQLQEKAEKMARDAQQQQQQKKKNER